MKESMQSYETNTEMDVILPSSKKPHAICVNQISLSEDLHFFVKVGVNLQWTVGQQAEGALKQEVRSLLVMAAQYLPKGFFCIWVCNRRNRLWFCWPALSAIAERLQLYFILLFLSIEILKNFPTVYYTPQNS